MAKSRKGSQIGAGQGREGLDIACAYACRVGGESNSGGIRALPQH